MMFKLFPQIPKDWCMTLSDININLVIPPIYYTYWEVLAQVSRHWCGFSISDCDIFACCWYILGWVVGVGGKLKTTGHCTGGHYTYFCVVFTSVVTTTVGYFLGGWREQVDH